MIKNALFVENDIEKILIKNKIIKKTLKERYQAYCKILDPLFRFLKILFWLLIIILILMVFAGVFD